MMDQPKVYSYIRFSTPEQAKGDSQRRQLEDAEEYMYLLNNFNLKENTSIRESWKKRVNEEGQELLFRPLWVSCVYKENESKALIEEEA